MCRRLHQDLTHSVCAQFEARSGDSRSLFTIAKLLSSLGARHFDADVGDSIIGKTSAVKRIATIRAKDAGCPIVELPRS